MNTPPETIDCDGQTWKLMKPGLTMRQHIGQLDAPGGEVFPISGALNGMAVYLETPYPHPNASYPGETVTYVLAADVATCADRLMRHMSPEASDNLTTSEATDG